MAKIPTVNIMFHTLVDYRYAPDLTFVLILLAADICISGLSYLYFPAFLLLCAVPLLFFIPGYCFISSMLPRGGDVGLIGRIGFAIGFSLALTAFARFVFSISPWVYSTEDLIAIIFSLSLVLWLAALYRRAMVRNQDRYIVRLSDITGGMRDVFSALGTNRRDRFLSAALVITVLVAIGTTLYVVSQPKENERFTEFFILGANHTASDYPYNIVAGQKYPVYLGVTNHEARNVTYVIETWDQTTVFDDINETTQITAMDPGDRFSLTVPDNETVVAAYSFSVDTMDSNRIAFLLFKSPPPGEQVTGSERINASYRDLYLRISVRQSFYQETNTNVM
jgi:uncharacterized membrane protein